MANDITIIATGDLTDEQRAAFGNEQHTRLWNDVTAFLGAIPGVYHEITVTTPFTRQVTSLNHGENAVPEQNRMPTPAEVSGTDPATTSL